MNPRVLYAATTSVYWGVDRMGHIYGWFLSSNIPASAAPFIAGAVFDWYGSFHPNPLAIVVLLIVAICAVLSRRDALRGKPI
jgi:hypothetical protein